MCEHYRAVIAQCPLRRRGFPPALSDEEVITIEICGEYSGLSQDEDIYDYFRSHYGHFFPKLRERTSFVRQAANLWAVKAMIQQRLTYISGQADDCVQIIDTLPLPVCCQQRLIMGSFGILMKTRHFIGAAINRSKFWSRVQKPLPTKRVLIIKFPKDPFSPDADIAPTSVVNATAVSNPRLITGIVPSKTCIITDSN